MNENNEVVKLLRQINSKLESLVEEITNRLYGSETENWALFIMKNHLLANGWELEYLPIEEVNKIRVALDKVSKEGVDDFLILRKGDKRRVYLLEAKHNLNKENVEKAIEQMKIGMRKIADDIKKIYEIIPIFAFKTSSGLYTVEEALNEIERNFKHFVVITPDYRWIER